MNPYREVIKDNISYRTFSTDISEHELVWHRDREDRIVKAIHDTDWQIQLDNQLPQYLEKEVFIPKGMYHRVIKGSHDVTLMIEFL